MATTTTGDTTVPTVKKRTLNTPKTPTNTKSARVKKGTGNNPRPKTPTKGPAGPSKGTQARARQQGPGAAPPPTRAFQIPGGRTVNVGILAKPSGQKLPTLSGGGGGRGGLAGAMKAFAGGGGGGGTAGGFGGAKAPPASAFAPKTTPFTKGRI